MCVLYKYYKKTKTITGYKIAAQNKRTKKFYSVAMGFEYHNNMDVPKIEIQQQIGGYFIKDLLTAVFEKNMSGRTAVFPASNKTSLESVRTLAGGIRERLYDDKRKYKIVIIKMTLSGSLMEGVYKIDGSPKTVIAGRHIDKIEIIYTIESQGNKR